MFTRGSLGYMNALSNCGDFLSQAKSDEQIASERDWISDKVWLLHRGGFSAATIHSKDPSADGKVRIKLESNGQFLDVDEEDLEKVGHLKFVGFTFDPLVLVEVESYVRGRGWAGGA